MAIQGRGYYGIGATKKDFGFSSNMTLPLAGGYNNPKLSGVPQEGRSGRGRATLAVDQDDMVAYGAEKKSRSWKSRLSGFFRKDNKKDKKKDKDLVNKGGGTTKSSKTKPRLEEQEEKGASSDEIESMPDDINDAILMQEGLTQDSDEQDSDEEMLINELDMGPLEDEGSDLIVAQEVEVVYSDDLTDENNPQASPTEDKDDTELTVDPQHAVMEEHSDKESANRLESDMITSPSEKHDKNKSSQNEPETKEKTPSKQRKKKSKAENRKSTALEASTYAQHQDEDTGKKNGKTKKQRPKSMPAASLALADEQEIATDDHAIALSETSELVKRKSKARQPTSSVATPASPSEDKEKSKSKRPKEGSATTGDAGTQEAIASNETQPDIKKTKAKKLKEKNGATLEGQKVKASSESPVGKKKTTKAKQKAVVSEETFDSPISAASPPPPEEIRLPKQQVTVGVIKKKKQKTRPFLDVDGVPKSNVYQSDGSDQKQGQDDIDEDERELLHDMDTLQLMAEGEEKASDKKAKKKRQSKIQDESEVVTEVATEVKEGKQSKVSKGKTKKREAEAEVQPPQQPQVAAELDKKQPKRTKKTKGKGKGEPEIEAVAQSPPQPEAAVSEPDKKKSKKTKKSKGKGEPAAEPEGQPLLQVAEEMEKKPTKKTKKTKSKGKSEPVLEQAVHTPSQEEFEDGPKSGKKKSTKKTRGKGKVVEETDAATPKTPTKAAAALLEDDVGEGKSKKKKKKISKVSIGSPDSPLIHQQSDGGTPSNRSSRSQLSTKTSKSKVASEESDDLVWIGADKLPKKKSKSKIVSKDDTAVDEDLEAINLSSSSRSTSYHELSKEERKTFRDELRKASSQHSVDTPEGEGSVKVEIDPNVKVTKSGVVKGGKGSRRPSLQVDFVGSGIQQTDSASPNEEKGSDEKSKKISIDLSAVPQTTPSLGLTHGHDKRDLVNRSSSKRRPMSMRESLLLSKGEEAIDRSDSSPQNNILAAHISKLQKTSGRSNGSHRNSASVVYQAAAAKSQQREDSGHGRALARQLFPSAINGEPPSGEGSESSTLERSGSRRNKTVDKPVKTLGIASENTSAPGSSSPSVPLWVALAQNKQKRSSLLLADKEEENKSFSPVSSSLSPAQSSTPKPTTTTTNTTTTAIASGGARGRQGADSTIPKMGTVQARLAAFEKK